MFNEKYVGVFFLRMLLNRDCFLIYLLFRTKLSIPQTLEWNSEKQTNQWGGEARGQKEQKLLFNETKQ